MLILEENRFNLNKFFQYEMFSYFSLSFLPFSVSDTAAAVLVGEGREGRRGRLQVFHEVMKWLVIACAWSERGGGRCGTGSQTGYRIMVNFIHFINPCHFKPLARNPTARIHRSNLGSGFSPGYSVQSLSVGVQIRTGFTERREIFKFL